MIERIASIEPVVVAVFLMRLGAALALAMMSAVVLERAAYGYRLRRRRRLEQRYVPLIRLALAGDRRATRRLAACPSRHRMTLAELLITPLIDDRDPARIARTREIAREMSLLPVAGRFLRSLLWWRRAIALRALGLLQDEEHTASIVAALDDSNPSVRGAALDALTDLRDPASLPAIVVRLHDASLARGRRVSALTAFGPRCEPFLLELSEVDPEHRLNYTRALALCGTDRSRPALCHWTRDARIEVRAAAFEALAHVSLDAPAAALAIEALESPDAPVRAMAARALRGWTGSGNAASHLARHLDDEWPVAVQAARSLKSMRETGLRELRSCSARPDLPGVLARQMLWEERTRP